ncbi:MAG: peptidase S41 [Proteobacteria bacterium]|nr:peptidase S41 [Pseudomonadota bacterium]
MNPPLKRAAMALIGAALLAGCGGGDEVYSPLPPLPGIACSTLDERAWLDAYFDEWYFWYRQAPNPNPARDMGLDEFFQASLYTGNDPQFPVADRWSYIEPTADFDRFFGDGRLLGYGVYLAGLETHADPARPLRVRYVEPLSDAAAQGVQRGERIVSVDGRAAAEIVAANDYAIFTPSAEGQRLTLVLDNGNGTRTVSLRAGAFALSPVTGARVLQTPQGRRMGYLHVKDMISQAESGIAAAFADFKAQGVQELAIDLRYNGGGLVSLSRTLASHVAAARTRNQTYARLLYNDKLDQDHDESVRFDDPQAALGLSRVYVLAGPRTCSAAELVINGLKPFVDVVVVGAASCGKPVGFQPVSRCDSTFNVVNFESVNAAGQGRYWNGIGPTCAVAEDLSKPLGSADETLLAAAQRHADGGGCPAASAADTVLRRALRAGAARGEPAERQGMWAR